MGWSPSRASGERGLVGGRASPHGTRSSVEHKICCLNTSGLRTNDSGEREIRANARRLRRLQRGTRRLNFRLSWFTVQAIRLMKPAGRAFMSSPFIGEIRMFAGNFAPVGWAFCNGALIPIAEN